MDETDAILKSILGVRPLITRAPGGVVGHFNKHYWDALKKHGYVEHDWNISSADAAPNHPVAKDFIDNIQSQVDSAKAPSSAIILMHSSSGHEETDGQGSAGDHPYLARAWLYIRCHHADDAAAMVIQ